jgi:Holliday junction resolvasome RuvABC endonuclease subunit
MELSILALDLGTCTGWASLDRRFEQITTGTFYLATPEEVKEWRKKNHDRRYDYRIRRLFQWLTEGVCAKRYDLVVFEDVEFCKTTLQCQLWSALRSAIWCACPDSQVECVPVGEVKKFATGNCKADKEMMAEALRKSNPKRFSVDVGLKKKHLLYDHEAAIWGRGDRFMTDDAIDAYWILRWAQENIKR